MDVLCLWLFSNYIRRSLYDWLIDHLLRKARFFTRNISKVLIHPSFCLICLFFQFSPSPSASLPGWEVFIDGFLMSIFLFLLDGVIALGVIILLELSELRREIRVLRGWLTVSILQFYIEFHFSLYLMVQTGFELLHRTLSFLGCNLFLCLCWCIVYMVCGNKLSFCC